MLSGIFIGIVGTVVGGLILYWLVKQMDAWRSSRITAVYTEIVIPSHSADHTARMQIKKFAQENLPETLEVMLERVVDYTNFRVIVVKLQNGGGVRSGAIEIMTDRFALWHVQEKYTLAPSDNTIKIGQLDPNAELIITVIGYAGTGYISRSLPSIVVLEDGKKVRAYRDNFSGYQDPFGIARLFLRHPTVAYVILLAIWLLVLADLGFVASRFLSLR